MLRLVFAVALLVGGFVLADLRAADQNAADVAAVMAATDAYTAAYNRGDAKAIAECWCEKGEYVSPTGEKLKGRENIQKGLEEFLSDNKGLQVQLAGRSVWLVTADTAIENGTAKVTHAGETATETAYEAVYVRLPGGAWKVDSIREKELPVVVPPSERLKGLEWIIGEWGGEKAQAKFEWAWNKNYIKATFKADMQDKMPLEGNQVIGWDPVAGAIRSWVFDSDGAHAEGIWKQNGNRWLIKFTNVLTDGTKATATNIYTRIDDNTCTWQSVGRQVDGHFMPNIPEFKIVRKSPGK